MRARVGPFPGPSPLPDGCGTVARRQSATPAERATQLLAAVTVTPRLPGAPPAARARREIGNLGRELLRCERVRPVLEVKRDRPLKVSDRTYFVLKRLHSLSGVVPVGLFLIEHFFTNARSLQGPQAFDQAAAELARIPFVVLLEALGIWLPILFHMVVGILIATTAQANLGRHGYARNWQYVLQRVTGVILVFYILFHTWSTRFDAGYLGSTSAYQFMREQLASPAVQAFYVVGILSACYHFGNGLFGFAVHWGLVTGRRAQVLASRVGLAVFIGLSALGIAAMLGFRGLRLDFLQKPHGTDHGTVVMTGSGRR